ncbi:sensor histidine kinase [Tuberibacillus sp. Marseille-P3662]|uniref:sensor histidine kinase n=1 Tax=Tuberibacillus sp. Marseille-P3662 TaxID=1965358 RepID=UPI000A1CCE87|nr:ATP-binding protein [Tuberibacillus sp. Marseille-P3662]
MINNSLSVIQKRLVTLIINAVLLAGGLTFLLFQLIYTMVDYLPFYMASIFYFIHDLLGQVIPFTLIYIALFLVFILLLSRKWSLEFQRLQESTDRMMTDQFDDQDAPKFSYPEWRKLSDHIKQVSDQLQSAMAEERRAVEGKNELITNVSHDLRTPLTSIIGYMRLIEGDQYIDEVELRYYTSVVYDKSLRLERMVNDLFEYTRLNFGYPNLNDDEIDLIQLLMQLKSQLHPQLNEAGMDVHLYNQVDQLIITADGDKLARVFENLLMNAVKYGKGTKTIDLSAQTRGHEAIIDVTNYGPKIPEAELPHIFERFYRVEKSRAVETGGSGLGLAITKSIVDLYGGHIDVVSTHHATTFKVVLPLINQ